MKKTTKKNKMNNEVEYKWSIMLTQLITVTVIHTVILTYNTLGFIHFMYCILKVYYAFWAINEFEYKINTQNSRK